MKAECLKEISSWPSIFFLFSNDYLKPYYVALATNLLEDPIIVKLKTSPPSLELTAPYFFLM